MELREGRDIIMRMNKGDPTDIQKEALDVVYKILDTGLTPEQIRKLKERDTAKTPVEIDDKLDMYVCPSCDMAIGTMEGREYHHFCLNCGQRIEWEE